ncbi:S1/P1 nuclease [Aestuariibacter halophilus]|uniref:S1/P1 nuclease n=1 Tax=Fluctibacter halophilus TaxID=226011 RepID=A0ABS8GAS6_9ALTE|nr:S1/P1 nuclease [Aestuariibacter halophilus]MCC2617618.1 S1/P1 nuclease [Aestuariibacter halophilus]
MIKNLLAIIAVGVLFQSPAFGWGQTGHRISGQIAQAYLTPQAQAQIAALFPTVTLAEMSTLADEMRSEQTEFWQKTANPWHYVTVPHGKTYAEAEHPEHGDAYTALQDFSRTLKDPKAPLEDRRLALHFIVHIIGDLHQPLHAGNGTDRGGNDVKLEFFWQNSNLHRVWDSGMIDQKQLSYTEWSDWLLAKITAEQQQQWLQNDPLVWIKESTAIRDTIYPDKDAISYQYLHQNLPTVKQRLQQAGVRIASYLNALFSQP